MKVHVAIEDWPYESGKILGVYDDFNVAARRCDSYRKECNWPVAADIKYWVSTYEFNCAVTQSEATCEIQ